MLCIAQTTDLELLAHVSRDPVRPHIPAEQRIGVNRDMFFLENQGEVHAVTCVSYLPDVPATESELFETVVKPSVAVFYTIWSYRSGAGRELLLSTVEHIQQHRCDIQRFVTLSPKTEMAYRFHINNGARVLRENTATINYEYC